MIKRRKRKSQSARSRKIRRRVMIGVEVRKTKVERRARSRRISRAFISKTFLSPYLNLLARRWKQRRVFLCLHTATDQGVATGPQIQDRSEWNQTAGPI